jgi:hypothetical protein
VEVFAMLKAVAFVALALILVTPLASAQSQRFYDRYRIIDDERFDRDFRPDRYPDRERYRRWIFLGERTVDFRADRDVIEVGYSEDWYRQRSFRGLQLFAERSDVFMIRLRISYLNDYAEEINIERVIPEGGNLAVPLEGERSYIRRIELFYRVTRDADTRGIIRVYGEPFRL